MRHVTVPLFLLSMLAVTCIEPEPANTNVEVESVSMNPDEAEMVVGETLQLVLTVMPSDATYETITWASSKQFVASVDANGLVTANAEGTATITARIGVLSASCKITVEKNFVPVTSVSLDFTSMTLLKGQNGVLVAKVLPEDATDPTVTWKISSDYVADVSETGVVTAKNGGNTIIMAVAGDKNAYCQLTVLVPVDGVSLDQSSLTMFVGGTATLAATVSPADATDKTVKWSSSDVTVVNVDGGGVLTAISEGVAVVSVSTGSFSAYCVVTVAEKDVAVADVLLDRSAVSLLVGESVVINAAVVPSNATEKTIAWNSSDETVASVDKNGKVRALKKGTAVVTASCSGKSANCDVTVSNIPMSIAPTEVLLPGGGGSFDVTVTCSSEYHINSKPEWVSEVSVESKVHSFKALANGSQEERSGVIVFCDDEGTCLSCFVKQAAGGAFSVFPAVVELGAIGGDFEVRVSCSTGYHISGKPEWITEVTEEGAMPQLHIFRASVNSGSGKRSGVITFCDDKGACLPCSVSQKSEQDPPTGGNEDVSEGEPVNW